MVPMSITIRGSLSNCLLNQYPRKTAFNFHQYCCGCILRRLYSASLCNAIVPQVSAHFPSKDYHQIEPLRKREDDTVNPNYQTYLWILEGSVNSSSGPPINIRKLHGLILKLGFDAEHELCGRLLCFYAANGQLDYALELFDDMLNNSSRIPVSVWNTVIAGFAANKLSGKVLDLFFWMLVEDVIPDEYTFVNLLKACNEGAGRSVGFCRIEQIHAIIIRHGFAVNPLVCNPLIDLYSKNGFIQSAKLVFEDLYLRDSVSWVAMISGLSQNSHEEQAILLFCNEMHCFGIFPTPYVLSSVLSACTKIARFELGKELHALVFKWGFASEVFVCNAFVSLYCRWGDLTSAEQIFEKMLCKDGVSYNSLISGLAQHGFSDRSLQLFQNMQRDCLKPDCVTVASLLSACATNEAPDKGRQLHAYALKAGFCLDMIIEGSLLDLYVKCSDIEAAKKHFLTTGRANVVLWNVMLVAYGQMGNLTESCQIFSQMQVEGLEPNQYTYPSILRTCTSVGAVDIGEQIHAHVVKTGFQFNMYVSSVLIDMYVKHGHLNTAEKIFTRLTEDDLVSWTAMIAGYVRHDVYVEALKLFEEMQNRGIQSDNIGFSSAISACAGIQALNQGRQVHAQSVISGYSEDLSIGNALGSHKVGTLRKHCRCLLI